MKVACIIFALLVASAQAAPISQIVDGLCPEIKTALAGPQFTTLAAALEKAGAVDIPIPAGNVTFVAPINDAFAAVLKAQNLTAEELLASPALGSILALHVIGGNTSAAGGAATITPTTVTVAGAESPVDVTKGPVCPGVSVLVAKSVLLPAAAVPTPAPAPAVPTPAPTPAPAGTSVTIGDLVAKLCPDIKKALEGSEFTTLNLALTALSSAKVEVPAGATATYIGAPTNEAFNKALSALGVTPPQALSNPALLATVLKAHIMAEVGGKIMTLGGDMATITGKSIDVEGSMAPVEYTSKVECKKEAQTAFVLSEVIVPLSVLPGPMPAPKPSVVPKPAVAPKPVSPVVPKPSVAPAPGPVAPSSAVATSFVGAALVAVVALLA